jgi:hypothetical protein
MVSIARYMLKLMKRDDIINYLNSGGIFSQLILWVLPLVTGSKHFTRKKERYVESTFQQYIAPI